MAVAVGLLTGALTVVSEALRRGDESRMPGHAHGTLLRRTAYRRDRLARSLPLTARTCKLRRRRYT
jgi:hypothetical protein